MRAYFWVTLAMDVAGFTGFIAAMSDSDAAPLVLAPIIPIVMSVKLWRRGKSLQEVGLKLRRVLLMPRAKWVLPETRKPTDRQLAKVASRDVLEGPAGRAIRAAAEDRLAILDIIAGLSKADRKLLPEVEPAVNALVERIGHLARMLHRMDANVEAAPLDELDARIARMQREGLSLEGERRLALLKRQRDSLVELAEHRETLSQQLDNAVLMLGNLRLDVVKLRTSGLHAGALGRLVGHAGSAGALARNRLDARGRGRSEEYLEGHADAGHEQQARAANRRFEKDQASRERQGAVAGGDPVDPHDACEARAVRQPFTSRRPHRTDSQCGAQAGLTATRDQRSKPSEEQVGCRARLTRHVGDAFRDGGCPTEGHQQESRELITKDLRISSVNAELGQHSRDGSTDIAKSTTVAPTVSVRVVRYSCAYIRSHGVTAAVANTRTARMERCNQVSGGTETFVPDTSKRNAPRRYPMIQSRYGRLAHLSCRSHRFRSASTRP
jgi:hypothetical protein